MDYATVAFSISIYAVIVHLRAFRAARILGVHSISAGFQHCGFAVVVVGRSTHANGIPFGNITCPWSDFMTEAYNTMPMDYATVALYML